MRQNTGRERKQLTKIVCNQCGRILKIQNGILQEGVFRGMADWGFFSEKDREIQNKYTAEKKAVALAVDRSQSGSFYLWQIYKW